MALRLAALAVSTTLLLAACAGAPRSPPALPPATIPPTTIPPVDAPVAAALSVLRAAESAIGTPYLYGGSTPQGFDCSGLVFFAHQSASIRVPRTAAAQQRAASPVPRSALAPGDLVFFATGRSGVDHVGVYAGGGRFVHAPASGRVVSYAWLEDPWYAARFVSAGRFWSSMSVASAGRGLP